jgi:hypothetical protein
VHVTGFVTVTMMGKPKLLVAVNKKLFALTDVVERRLRIFILLTVFVIITIITIVPTNKKGISSFFIGLR